MTSNLEHSPSATGARERILDAASGLFAQQGFRATTLREIAAASGENSALVSYYFGNKEGLRTAVLERRLSSVAALLDPVVKSDHKLSHEELKHFMRKLLAHTSRDEAFHRLAQRALIEDEESARAIAKYLWQPFFERLVSIFENVTDKGLSQAEREARCLCLTGFMHQYAKLRWYQLPLLHTQEKSEDILREYERLVVDQILEVLLRH